MKKKTRKVDQLTKQDIADAAKDILKYDQERSLKNIKFQNYAARYGLEEAYRLIDKE